MKVGYIRVSTNQQNLDRQRKQMKENKVEIVYEEQQSGKDISNRPEFQEMLAFVRKDDTVVVTSLDRLGRNYDDTKQVYRDLREKGVQIEVLDAPFLNFNTNNKLLDQAMSDMFLSLLSYIAQNEREAIHERQRQGIELAKKQGKYKGRQAIYTKDSRDKQKQLIYQQIIKWYQEGVPVRQIARESGVSRNTVYRILKDLEKEGL
ncbi:hypothetical protein CBF34_00830 [Vagococcus penaei]|uniref:Recombinase family protein n=2 Tax=Vagococcus TaxID=2737 RepID=A0AAW8U4A9_9ENTE|nr:MULTISPECIES: recombinase family protein [Vagococcus]AQP54628.1 hypothetical protein BW732_10710 [Vagococcus penaei]MDT2834401.1 recombinase family protein [Vagococcus carniphilus]RSU06659.1 hypothetical protein CBF34_00830 [Vagococcus penaei]